MSNYLENQPKYKMQPLLSISTPPLNAEIRVTVLEVGCVDFGIPLYGEDEHRITKKKNKGNYSLPVPSISIVCALPNLAIQFFIIL
jgi:hypothetical protein